MLGKADITSSDNAQHVSTHWHPLKNSPTDLKDKVFKNTSAKILLFSCVSGSVTRSRGSNILKAKHLSRFFKEFPKQVSCLELVFLSQLLHVNVQPPLG